MQYLVERPEDTYTSIIIQIEKGIFWNIYSYIYMNITTISDKENYEFERKQEVYGRL